MSSINTNVAAMTALANLQSTNSMMDETQNRISTGYKVGSAQDNAAYWSIATTMRSDNKAMSAVQDSLGIGAASADVAYTALNATKDVLDEVKAKLVAASQPGVDKGKIQTEIGQLKEQLKSIAGSASFNGDNWLSNSDASVTMDTNKAIVSSLNRTADGVSVGKIDIAISSMKLVDAADQSGILDQEREITYQDADGDEQTVTFALLGEATAADPAATPPVVATTGGLDITDATSDELNAYIKGVDEMITEVTTAASTLGAAQSRIEIQQNFTSNLMDALDRGIGTLVDADMTEESTRLKALQTQQQLGVQALSIANASSQNLLSLFR